MPSGRCQTGAVGAWRWSAFRLRLEGSEKSIAPAFQSPVFRSCDRSERPQRPKRPGSPLRELKSAPARSKFIKRCENLQVNCESPRSCHRNASSLSTTE